MRKRLTCSSLVFVLMGTGGSALAEKGTGTPDSQVVAAASEVPAVPAEAASQAAGGESSGGGLFEQSQAGGESATPAPDKTQPTMPFTLNGYTRGDVYLGKVPEAGRGETKAAYGELALALRTAKFTHGDGYAEVRLRYGFQGTDQMNATAVDVREAYVNTYLGPIDLRLGKQIIVWGRADMLNPTNNLTPADFRARSPIEDDRRLGNMGARMFLRLAPVRLEGVWLPAYVATALPTLSLPKYVTFGDPTYPRPELKEGLGAVRAHLELASFEMSFSYLNGYAPLPGITLANLLIQPDDPARGQRPAAVLSRTAYRHQVVGFDFSTTIGTLLALRGEAAYRRPYGHHNRSYAPNPDLQFDPENPNRSYPRPDLQYVLGADHTFGSVSVIAQYLGRYTFKWKKERGAPSDPSTDHLANEYSEGAYEIVNRLAQPELAKTNQILFSQTARIQHLATARVEWLLAHDTLSLSLLGLRNFTTKEWLVAPKVGYRISDSMITYVGAEIFSGPDGTLFGMIDQSMSAGYAELRATF